MGSLPVEADLGVEKTGNTSLFDLDVGKVAVKVGMFRKLVVILQAFDTSPSRDRIVGWIHEIMVNEEQEGQAEDVRLEDVQTRASNLSLGVKLKEKTASGSMSNQKDKTNEEV
ncbi:hypothetical protein R1sor_002671 [Riccia sorocarpa]|uniref:Uncharacterized protein n=1 Tax=Riccia sorocarpa TaxID=122646 RepID=A0ABD3H5J3_9MARC